MKRRLKIAIVLACALLALAWWQWPDSRPRRSVETVRHQMRHDGFRTALSDFDFTVPSNMATCSTEILSIAREAKLKATYNLQLMEPVGTNAALSLAPIQIIESGRETNLWSALMRDLAEHGLELDRACALLLAGPIRFQPQLSGDIRLPHLAEYNSLARSLAGRSVLAMHEQRSNDMFTNLLALSRLVTAWAPEPADISHLVRFRGVDIAEEALWESMQTDLWSEDHLVALHREWESLRLFDGVPETAELACANMVRMCQTARSERYSEKIGGWGPLFRGAFRSPGQGFRDLWSAIKGYRDHAKYRDQGSFEDELALLNYYRTRHADLKRAVACSNWLEMRALPGVTNLVVFRSPKPSRIQSIMTLKQVQLGFQRGRATLVMSVAEAETKRRLIVTAIALERFALRHREYPPSLASLVPDLLPALPVDFIDGKPLRYRRDADGRYVLYSIGLDGVDDGGQTASPEYLSRFRRRTPYGRSINADIVWPRPARDEDLRSLEQPEEEVRPRRPTFIPGPGTPLDNSTDRRPPPGPLPSPR